jgi:hypothetical protein
MSTSAVGRNGIASDHPASPVVDDRPQKPGSGLFTAEVSRQRPCFVHTRLRLQRAAEKGEPPGNLLFVRISPSRTELANRDLIILIADTDWLVRMANYGCYSRQKLTRAVPAAIALMIIVAVLVGPLTLASLAAS